MTALWNKYAIAALAAACSGAALAQQSTIAAYDRCVGDSSAFARDEQLNEAGTEYLAKIQKEIESSIYISRVAGMAGQQDRSTQARLRADQYQRELQQACAHLSQSVSPADSRSRSDLSAPANQTANLQRQAVLERELNRRVPGATFLINEAGFSQWLEGRQGSLLRREAWDQALLAEDFEKAAQMLRDYEGAPKPR
jgi:hypothetical protein